MKLADAFPFYPSLAGPVHNRDLRDPGAKLNGGEVAIDDSWRIVAASADPFVLFALEDLRDFLSAGMGVPVGAAGSGPAIRLEVDPATGEGNPETHRVAVTSTGITVTGASPVGVLRGIIFIEDVIRTRRAPFLPVGEVERSPLFERRIHRSCMSPFLVEELTGLREVPLADDDRTRPTDYRGWQHDDAGPDGFYPDSILRRLVHHGFNAIWIRGALCQFSRCDAFPEFGRTSGQILSALRGLTERAARHGLAVYLYFNEPLGLPGSSDFWERYPQCKGSHVAWGDRYCLCTSTPEVKSFLHDGMAYLFRQAPDLGGVILITASEFPSHCYCHIPTHGSTSLNEYIAEGRLCPRCAERSAQEVVGEVVTLIRDGIRTQSDSAEVIAWNWSWSLYEPDPQEGILQRLPEDVIIMGDFERGIMTRSAGFDYLNDEYSLKIIGPSDRFKGLAEFAHRRGRKVFAKIQIGATHEDATVPYLPVLANVVRKFQSLKDNGVRGLMNCWNFGNMPSLTTELAGIMGWDDAPQSVDEALTQLATRHFGRAAAPRVAAGWKLLSDAMQDFPGSIPVQYYGPVNRGPVLPLFLEQKGKEFPRSWLPDVDIEGDDLSRWTPPFGPEQVIKSFRALYDGWVKGLDALRTAIELAQGEDRTELVKEVGVAEMCALQFRCAANITEFIVTRDQWHAAIDTAKREPLRQRMLELLEDERETCEKVLPLLAADPRLGFHGEAYGYLVTDELVRSQLDGIEQTMSELGKG